MSFRPPGDPVVWPAFCKEKPYLPGAEALTGHSGREGSIAEDPMEVFLTGGTGFIGSYVAMELVRHGHHVTILARNRNKVPALGRIDGIDIVESDLNRTGTLRFDQPRGIQ